MWVFRFKTSLEKAEALATLLEEHSLAVSWFELSPTPPLLWQIDVIFEEEPDRKWLEESLREIDGLEEDYVLEPVPDVDWVSENRKSFPALSIGPFYIFGSHDKLSPPKDKICFKIDAATAFGTGQHASTHGCLMALHDLKKKGLHISRFLDLGCGTAILAMAMARLFEGHGIASDNDPEAVAMARLNVVENHIDRSVDVILSEGFDHIDLKTSFELIAANILADPLIQLAPEMAKHLKKEGYVVLSGLLQTQQPQVITAYENQGLTLVKMYPRQEWTTLVLRK